MEINGVTMHCSRCRSPSSDRFLRLFTHPGLLPAAGVSDELNEAELFWTVDSPPSDGLPPPSVESKYQLAEKCGIKIAVQDKDGQTSRRRVLHATPPPAKIWPNSNDEEREMPSSGARLLQNSAATPMTMTMSMTVPNKAIAVEFKNSTSAATRTVIG